MMRSISDSDKLLFASVFMASGAPGLKRTYTAVKPSIPITDNACFRRWLTRNRTYRRKFALIASDRSLGVRSGKRSGIRFDSAAIDVEMLATPEVGNRINPKHERSHVGWCVTIRFVGSISTTTPWLTSRLPRLQHEQFTKVIPASSSS